MVAALVFTLLSTWRTGRLLVADRLLRRPLPLSKFVANLARDDVTRVPGASAYLFRHPGITPPALRSTLRHHDSLHEQVLVLAVVTEERPHVPPRERAELTDLGDGFHEVVSLLIMTSQTVRNASPARSPALGTDLKTLTYFLGRESLHVTPRAGMARWRERLFVIMSRNATSAADYFKLPFDQTVEVSRRCSVYCASERLFRSEGWLCRSAEGSRGSCLPETR